MSGALQQALLMVGSAPITDLIHLWFDDGNGSTAFSDQGTAGTTWTGAGSAVETSTGALSGISSLSIPNVGSAVLSAPYSASNCLPATADWDLEFIVNPGTVASTYMVSVQDSGTTAAGTAIAVVTNASSQLVVILSDGTTRSIIVAASAATAIASGVTKTIKVTRRTSTIALSFNGTQVATGTFSGSINLPTGQSWRIGKPVTGTNNGMNGLYDNFRIAY